MVDAAGAGRAGRGVTAIRDAEPALLDAGLWLRCHGLARDEGVAPAITLLRDAVLPGMLPYGPAGHAVLPAELAEQPDWGACLGKFGLPGGPVVVLRRIADPVSASATEHQRAAWALGLLWLRLGLSEALREGCLGYLRGRRTGDSVLLQQQLVKGVLADALSEHLEIRAVLGGAEPGELPAPAVDDLHDRITLTGRAQLRLLGASGFLMGGPGEVAYVSELLADAYRTEELR